ncbi:tubulin-folding cofactor C [Impatiens glandulifera]|uniref:tubulin-folding cofactor C n=1 Tax=Impatiens glandulifera TaxID=253017 RepID=UPI001FB193F8|nr:tubulin-folding cofactor C [Impatiens glandulifera]
MAEEESTTLTAAPATAANAKKHAAMLERLSNRKQSISRSSDSFESTQSFLNRFSESKLSIDSEIVKLHTIAESNLRSDLKSDIERVSISISNLEKLVAENSYFLPSYEVRNSLKLISDLKQTLEQVSSHVAPKKRFAFKNKKASTGPSIEIGSESESESASGTSSIVTVRDSPAFRNEENQILVKDFTDSDIGEFSIEDLKFCEVHLTGCCRALFIHRLYNCKVYVGPVSGSILIDEAEDCVFVLASHQIRIHHTKKSDFFLRVRSRPIIEDSTGLRFAPYCLIYNGIEKDLKDSNLDEETGNWTNVDDFRWLRAVQSPNWSILPENERLNTITIS